MDPLSRHHIALEIELEDHAYEQRREGKALTRRAITEAASTPDTLLALTLHP